MKHLCKEWVIGNNGNHYIKIQVSMKTVTSDITPNVKIRQFGFVKCSSRLDNNNKHLVLTRKTSWVVFRITDGLE